MPRLSVHQVLLLIIVPTSGVLASHDAVCMAPPSPRPCNSGTESPAVLLASPAYVDSAFEGMHNTPLTATVTWRMLAGVYYIPANLTIALRPKPSYPDVSCESQGEYWSSDEDGGVSEAEAFATVRIGASRHGNVSTTVLEAPADSTDRYYLTVYVQGDATGSSDDACQRLSFAVAFTIRDRTTLQEQPIDCWQGYWQHGFKYPIAIPGILLVCPDPWNLAWIGAGVLAAAVSACACTRCILLHRSRSNAAPSSVTMPMPV